MSDSAPRGGTDYELLSKIIKYKKFEDINLIKGDIMATLPAFLQNNPQIRFNFIHLDVDVYEPTYLILNSIYSRLVPGAIIMIDDYNAVSGATEAVDEFISKYSLKLEKLPINHAPAFIVK